MPVMTGGAVVEPLELRTSDEDIDDLRRRVRATRWPDAPADAGWSMGADVGYLRELALYWAEEYDWRAHESEIAALPHVSVTVDGIRVAVIHARGRGEGSAFPLLLNHGWPDSSWRFRKLVPLLVDPGAHGGDPADAFDVVVPDMPGFGYSDTPPQPLDAIGVAAMWAKLMDVLGYRRFGTSGGDIGSHVSRFLALDQPDRVVAVHRTDGGLPVYPGDPTELTEPEREWMAAGPRWAATEGAYAAMHRTKPQTAGVGLTDSPAGLAAWIVEKLRAWSDCGGDLESAYSKDEILTLVTQYWMTGTITSSMRMYRANAAMPLQQLTRRVDVPSGFSIFRGDLLRVPREWLERTTNLVYFSEPARGGHFAAYEQPELFARELREFFRPFRSQL